MPDGRVDTPDNLDMIRIDPPAIPDMCGPERLTRTGRRLLRCGDGVEATPCTR